ncbi:hypothetical protein AB0D59_32310 [Streptomyces sp. NPDC048417]|uniref:hypothetical protein n=1 Tax=Streptomyces sp. NPDC048417 TaxID=3155387 RepID=UPI00341BA102
MSNPTVPAEHLLALAADFTRHNDALAEIRLTASGPATALNHQTALAQHLSDSALHIVDVLNAQSMYHSPAIHAVYARVKQLAQLTIIAADHLLDAADILDVTRAGIPVNDDGLLLTSQQALDEARSRLTLVRDLTALGAKDALATAELFIAERRRRGARPLHQPPALSTTQGAALRAIAQGEVTIAGDRPIIRSDCVRVSISTVRSLESRGLVTREPCSRRHHDERVHLTADGSRGLAATFGLPRPPVPTAARPASRPTVTTARAATG